MCGIAGFFSSESISKYVLSDMVSSLNHRGPDNHGLWLDNDGTLGLGHARLSIQDLSSSGHQPMHSPSDRYVLIFNGEIYNHIHLRNEVDKVVIHDWVGSSDTESLLAAIDLWGLDVALDKASGMFALALWDKQLNKLFLSRDRFGEKPLYYGWVNGIFVFASELKALKQLPKFNKEIDRNALALFLRFNSIPAPYSIYQDIFKLEPGCILEVDCCLNSTNIKQYWSTEEVYRNGLNNRFAGTPADAVSKLDFLLGEAVSSQMTSDVPLGAFLSGGIDSSAIVALMQARSSKKINTFSIGFNAKEYNEAEHARAVANHLGTDHYEMYVTDRDALDVIPFLPEIYDEPFADSSQIPTYLVSKIAKQHVTVALSGDAGDELFGGYNRYVFAEKMFRKISTIPLPLRRIISKTLLSISEHKWNYILSSVLSKRFANVGSKIHKGANVMDAETIRDLHLNLASQVQTPINWLINSNEYPTIFNDSNNYVDNLNSIEQMMVDDLLMYLPTDILTKVDRAAMAVSLETRVPFLDRNVVEFSASLPLNYKIRDGVSKWILREVLYKYVPKNLIERPKMGFGVPLENWLRGPLRDWAESLLDEQRLADEGYFNVHLVRNKWNEHLSGKCNWHHQLWNVLMFQAWLEKNK